MITVNDWPLYLCMECEQQFYFDPTLKPVCPKCRGEQLVELDDEDTEE